MNLKSFLKPDWIKIVIFLILILITTFVPFFATTAFNMTTGEEHVSSYSLFDTLSYCFSVKTFDSIYENFLYKQECPQSLQFLLILIILNYLISCLIVWIYNKVKK